MGLATDIFRRALLLGVLREVSVDPSAEEEVEPVNVVGELVPPARSALYVDRVLIHTCQSPGELLVAESKDLLPFRELSLVGAGLFIHDNSLLSRALEAKGQLPPSDKTSSKSQYISYWSQNVNTFVLTHYLCNISAGVRICIPKCTDRKAHV